MGANLGVSGGQGAQDAASANYYLGDDPTRGWSPSLDMVYRLSGLANQSQAQSNLAYGGGGYGGSFETAAQKAQRAAGLPVDNSKPYGGWGGYGSNSYMQYGEPMGGEDLGWGGYGSSGQGSYDGAPGDNSGGASGPVQPPYNQPPVYTPPTQGQPPQGGGYPAPTGPPPSTSAPAPPAAGAPYTPPKSAPYDGETPTNTQAARVTLADMPGITPERKQGIEAIAKAKTEAGIKGFDQAWIDAEVKKADAETRQNQLGKVQSGEPSDRYSAEYIDWQLAKQREGLSGEALAKFNAKPMHDPRVIELQKYLYEAGDKQGLDNPGDVLAALDAGVSMDQLKQHYGAIVNKYGPKALSVGHRVFARLDTSPEGIARLKSGEYTQNALNTQGVTEQLQPGGQPAAPKGSAAPSAEKMSATAPTGGGSSAKESDNLAPPDERKNGDAWRSPDGTVYTWSDSAGGWISTKDGSTWKPPKQSSGSGGSWPNPPGGDTGNTGGDGNTGGGGGGGGGGGDNGNGEYGAGGPPEDQDPDGSKQPPGDYPPWMNKFADWKYRTDLEKQSPAFSQGSNDQVTPDAWSTSAPWRPEEPTGGLQGAYSELAGGKLTPYEDAIGGQWRGMANDPMGWADDLYANDLAQYQRDPGKGIDEAYGAYNSMINSQGYSPAEKGAIEASAVRGVTSGYRQNADEMRRQAARTGNAQGAYAALASAGANYGANLGETNRQNQVKFADETQRRHEVGAGGMTNVAGLAQQKSQFGLNQGAQFANEQARRKETGIRGMGDYAAFGRGLQQQGLAGMNDLYKQNQGATMNYYNMIAGILGKPAGSYTSGEKSSLTAGVGVGV